MFHLPLNLPNRRVRTRMHGGVGGVEPRGLPLSRLWIGGERALGFLLGSFLVPPTSVGAAQISGHARHALEVIQDRTGTASRSSVSVRFASLQLFAAPRSVGSSCLDAVTSYQLVISGIVILQGGW